MLVSALLYLSLSLIAAHKPCGCGHRSSSSSSSSCSSSSSSSKSSSSSHVNCPNPVVDVQVDLGFNMQGTDIPQIGAGPNDFSYFEPFSTGFFNGTSIGATSLTNIVIVSNKLFPVTTNDVLHVKTNANFLNQAISGITSPLGINQDAYYGSGIVGFFDPVNGWALYFVLTNTKVYALYCRLPIARTPGNNYFAFTYIVPVASRVPIAYNNYDFSMDRAAGTLTWTMDKKTVLIINKVGGPIDSKFQVGVFGGDKVQIAFPEQVIVLLAALIPGERDGTLCQIGTFDQCRCGQTIQNAKKTYCRTAPIQDPNTYQVEYYMTMANLNVYRTSGTQPLCNLQCRLLN